jgi:hypothetical protein
MKLDVVRILDQDDGSCLVTFEMDEHTKETLIQYAIKHILTEAAKKTIEENEPK